MYALFDGDVQISKAHAMKEVLVIEACERKLVIDYSGDFIGQPTGRVLSDDISIREVKA